MSEQSAQLAGGDLAWMHPIEARLFSSLDDDGDGLVSKAGFLAELGRNGLSRKDPRLNELFARLDAVKAEEIDFAAFLDIIHSAAALIERMLIGDLAVPDFAEFSGRITELFDATEKNEDGQQATYIPPLAEVNPDQFAVAIISCDGQLLELGRTETDFSVQSACKPFNYCYALNELGSDKVHQHVGMEPSGQAFNARVLMADGTGRPHNPMINAGAIMTASLIRADDPLHRRLEYLRTMWSKMIGGPIPRFNAWMAQEESRTGDNNRALGYMMKAAGVLLHGEDAVDHELRDALELYFSACSLEMNTRELATAAATLANNGVCPITQERVLDESTVRNCLTMMQMCGMYDGSGEFSLKIGLPAKSGVGGAVFLVVPRLMGVCVWSPRLDAIGNSVRGVEMAERIASTFRLHLYDGVSAGRERIDPGVRTAQTRARETSQALRAAGLGDLRTLQRLLDDGSSLMDGDYDRRTPMHLAAAEGQTEVVRFLLERAVDPNSRDRWGGTPLADAEFAKHADVIELLKGHDAEMGDAEHLVSDSSVTEHAERHADTEAVVELLWAASESDLIGLRRCLAEGMPVSACDYDDRTALHLAAADGRVEAVQYLLAHGHPLHVRDRWGSMPLDEARREGRDEVAQILAAAAEDFRVLTLAADYTEIGRAAGFVEHFALAHGIEPLIPYRVNAVLEDVLMGLIDSSDGGSAAPVRLELEVTPEHLEVTVSSEGEEFNPLQPADGSGGDTDDAEMKEVSLRLIQGFTDDADYQRRDGQNVLRLTFGLTALPFSEPERLSA
jgi:glutaminase